MSELSEQFKKKAIASWLEKTNWGTMTGVTEITRWEELQESRGYCDTCRYTITKVRIDYVNSAGKPDSYEYYGSFSELLNSLLED